MAEQSVEVPVQYADWSNPARAGMVPSSGKAGLTAAVSEVGGLSLYLERDGAASLLHLELGGDDARRLYEFLHARLGEPCPPRRGSRGRKKAS